MWSVLTCRRRVADCGDVTSAIPAQRGSESGGQGGLGSALGLVFTLSAPFSHLEDGAHESSSQGL